jgi:hypothetical protein
LKSKPQGGRKIGKEQTHIVGSYGERFVTVEIEEVWQKANNREKSEFVVK